MFDKCATTNDSLANVQDILEFNFIEGHNKGLECTRRVAKSIDSI